ncbi:MAG: indole-3-glycerol phosphate synthase TrpC [Candidatus Tectomicrobia bacterium]|nr:indole-3-glycerol phosphate synthase TrpC [Candidatus Tectomicrobia bacterium]
MPEARRPAGRPARERTVLEEIVDSVRAALEEERRRVPLPEVRRRAADAPPPRGFKEALAAGGAGDARIIAEAKRASPSAGVLAASYDPAALALRYERGGAAALSILTEPRYFQGRLSHLCEVRKSVSIPLLRKDFTVSPYQVYQARAAGADAVLLIVQCLADEELRDLRALARELGMAALVEAHTAEEVERAAACGAEIIGVNNRDLANFHTDPETSLRLAAGIPEGCVKVAESGIRDRADIERLQRGGFRCFLVGEALMRAPDPAAKIRELRGEPPAGTA